MEYQKPYGPDVTAQYQQLRENVEGFNQGLRGAQHDVEESVLLPAAGFLAMWWGSSPKRPWGNSAEAQNLRWAMKFWFWTVVVLFVIAWIW